MKEKLITIWLFLRFIIKLIINYFRLGSDEENNYTICKNISKEVIRLSKVNLTVIGNENINISDNSVLIVSNHRSFFDIFLLIASINENVPFVAAKKLYNYPILNKFIKSINCVLVNPYVGDISELKLQLKQIQNHLKNNSLILFPEGECSYLDGEIKEFKKGGFFSLDKTKTWIVPAYIHVKYMKKVGKWCTPTGDVTVIFGKPFKSNEIDGKKTNSSYLAKYAHDRVNELKSKITD